MSMFSLSLRRVSVATAVALGATSLFVVADGSKAPAQAQGSVSIEFRGALEPYGQWRQHPRFGEVWVPANRPRNWRPYTRGHWVYT
ncbi:MAG TPA: DUF6600 domain-containing protein, partial [Aestuariivirgaceae bacterium]|nr:DUF6600 domain-containing protein [Aestuariivirgaceae bacterium]